MLPLRAVVSRMLGSAAFTWSIRHHSSATRRSRLPTAASSALPPNPAATLRYARGPADCGDLLLDQSDTAASVVQFVRRKGAALLRGAPASGKTWLIPAIVNVAKQHAQWSAVTVVDPHDFVEYMSTLRQKAEARPLVIVDEAHVAWTPAASKYIKNLAYADLLFITTAASSAVYQGDFTPEVLRDKQLWLSAVSTDEKKVKAWIGHLVDLAPTTRTDDAKARLIEHTFTICGGHIGRILKFLEAVLDGDGISVPRTVFDSERSVSGGNGSAVDIFRRHPTAAKVADSGCAYISAAKLRNSKREKDHEFLKRVRLGFFMPMEAWAATDAVVPIEDNNRWSLSSAAQRDYVEYHRPSVPSLERLPIESPLDMLLYTLPMWRTDLLFVRDEDVKRKPFLEKHVHQAFTDAAAYLRALRPQTDARVVYEVPVPYTGSGPGAPPSLDFVVYNDADNTRYGIEFLVDSSIKKHSDRFIPGTGAYAPLKLDDHLTVYFCADREDLESVQKFVRSTRATCAVFPSPVRGWDLFHVLEHTTLQEAREIIVPRVGGTSRELRQVPRM